MVESSIGSLSSPIRPSPSIAIRFATSLSKSRKAFVKFEFEIREFNNKLYALPRSLTWHWQLLELKLQYLISPKLMNLSIMFWIWSELDSTWIECSIKAFVINSLDEDFKICNLWDLFQLFSFLILLRNQIID